MSEESWRASMSCYIANSTRKPLFQNILLIGDLPRFMASSLE